jgi:hypothetical protein
MNTSALKTLLGIVIALSIPLALHADNIVFDVLANSVTVITNGSTLRLGGPGCGFVFMEPEACVILLTPPSAGTHPGGSFQLINYSEPGNPLDVADTLEISPGSLPFPPFIPNYTIDFSAYLNAGAPCDAFLSGCIGPATGSPQTAFTLDWFNSVGAVVSTDTVNVESGAVPEPSAIPWLLVASALLGIAVRRRKYAA